MLDLFYKAAKKITLDRGCEWKGKLVFLLQKFRKSKDYWPFYCFYSDIAYLILQIKSIWVWNKTVIEWFLFNNIIQSLQHYWCSGDEQHEVHGLPYICKRFLRFCFLPRAEREREWILSTAELTHWEVSIALNHESFLWCDFWQLALCWREIQFLR